MSRSSTTRSASADVDRDRGSATAELAASLPVLVLLLMFGLTAVNAVTQRMRCLDAARDVALAVARGEAPPGVPEGASVQVSRDGDQVVAVVTARVSLPGGRLPDLTVTARATAAAEESGSGTGPST